MKKTTWIPLTLVCAASMTLLVTRANASSSLDFVNAISTQGGVAITQNLTYGDEPLQNLDVYYPKALATDINRASGDTTIAPTYPLIVFVNGGSWESGSKDQYKFVGESFAKAGYVTAVINYRKAPEHRYPDYVQDTAKAIAWTHANAARFYADANNMAVVGHSAGAFNVVAAVSNADFLAPYNMQPSDIKAVVGMAGPYSYDFRKYDSRTAFPEDGNPDDIMPDRLVKAGSSGKQPNYLLLTAEKDELVHDKNTLDMARALTNAGATVETVEIKKANHPTSIGAMSTSLTWLNDVRKQVLAYLDRQLGTSSHDTN